MSLNHHKEHFQSLLIIVAVSFILYGYSVKNGFLYDDHDSIVNNTLIKDFTNLPYLFQKNYFALSGEMSYRPVVTFTYFLDFALYGVNSWGYHLTNILIHAINGVLLYLFLTAIIFPTTHEYQRLSFRVFTNPPLIISLLFITHPILTEAVNAISYREDLLALFFYLASLNLYMRVRPGTVSKRPLTAALFVLSCLIYFLALFSKEIAVSFPVFICCYEWISSREKGLHTTIFRYSAVYVIITIIYLYIRFYCLYNPLETSVPYWSIKERILTIPWLIIGYLKLFIFPISLSADHSISPANSIFSQKFMVPLLLIAISSLLLLALRKRMKGSVFGFIFFLIALIPVYNLIPLANPFAERYLYLPSIGLFVSIGLAIHQLLNGLSNMKLRPYLLSVLFLLVIFSYSLLVLKKNRVWFDDHSLWSDAIRSVPNNSHAYYNLGIAYLKQNQYDEAVRQFRTAINLKPDYMDAHNSLGLAYYELGRFEDAIKYYQVAVGLNPNYITARMNLLFAHYALGASYFEQGLKDLARAEFERALELQPDFLPARQALELSQRSAKTGY